VSQEHAEDDVLTVAGNDHGAAGDEPVEHVRHRHRGDDEPLAGLIETGGVAIQQGAVDGGEELPHGRRPQEGGVGDGEGGDARSGGHGGEC
jgi:hypothetical protein